MLMGQMKWFNGNPNPVWMLEQIENLVSVIISMSGWSYFDAMTIVHWCIATYGFDVVRKFPVLIVFGRFGTGKTTLLEMIENLANPPKSAKGDPLRNEMRLSGDLSKAINRNKLAEGGTHCMDEADDFDERYLPKVFDRFSSNMTVNVLQGSGKWEPEYLEIQTALAMHRRIPLKDLPSPLNHFAYESSRPWNGGQEGSRYASD